MNDLAQQETTVESLRSVVRARWIVLLLATILVMSVEWATPGQARNTLAWVVLLVECCFNLFYGLSVFSRRLSRVVLPAGFLIDAAVISVWVVFSGGAVSVNMTYYLIILIAASLVHSPRMILGVGLGVIAMFLIAMQVSYGAHLASQIPSQAMNPFWILLEVAPEETRRVVYFQQSLRWTIWMVIVTLISATLVRSIWHREGILRERERRLDQQRRLLQLGELAGRLAHSINTPLGLISGNLEMLLKKTRKSSPVRQDLEKIMGFVQRAVNTVEDVLAYNRQNLSQIRPIDIADVVQSVVEATSARLEKKRGRLILDIQEKLPSVKGYPEAVYQAILNIVENAVDSLPENGGTVAVEGRFDLAPVRLSVQDERGDVKVIVRDNGSGIPAQEMKRIFEPFYTTKDFGHGTGLGLSIVKRIMEEHGGQVTAERNSEGGMKFVLSFPTGGIPRPTAGELPPDFYDR